MNKITHSMMRSAAVPCLAFLCLATTVPAAENQKPDVGVRDDVGDDLLDAEVLGLHPALDGYLFLWQENLLGQRDEGHAALGVADDVLAPPGVQV